ncbi:hypothetical protein OOU_Y34scaffold00925g13 [Pyricularia oryzae Y34]|uniref:Uncharacterized protein n=2 Tax=Pyricularia oryzae TaxID=318829 RepID=A0AA97NNS4_PYRO3|nr:hypothetical protein OOU_Y34scaffold00925g13 [Pyricularia oryzae Y34]
MEVSSNPKPAARHLSKDANLKADMIR